jgi:putative peptidoglycan lipid II flippase
MSMLRSAATVGGLTLVSRVLGFIRDQLIAFALGTSFVAEAFFVAQRFPNLFRALFAEGAFNNAFVPLFAKRVEGEGAEKARDFAIEVFSFLLAWLIVFSAAAMIAMPVVIYVMAPGFKANGETFQLAVDLTRICFPYLLFMSLTALQSGVLNSLNRFTAAAAAPILLNVVMIASNVVAWVLATGNTPQTGYIFAWGLFASGIAQYALLTIACRRAGMRLVPRRPRLTPDVKKVIKLSLPGIVSGGVMQINLVVATMIATTLPGAVAFLYYADRLYQLPLGVIGVAIGVVLLPDLSRRLRAGDEVGALNSQNRALELSMFLTLPAAIALMAIPTPIIHTVFEHGAFTRTDTFAVAPALLAFASGLVAFSLSKVFQPGFYAREDTSTPMRFAVVSVIVNVVGSIVLSRFMGHVGIALATSLAAWTNTLLLGVTLSRRGLFALDERSRHRLPRIVASALGMGGLLLAGAWLLEGNYAEHAGFLAAAWGLAVLVAGGILGYFGLAHVTGAMRLSELKSMLKR